MDYFKKISSWLSKIPYLHYVILGLASLSYIIQAWIYSQQQRSLLDEGNFLLKGYLFATGKYIPFQEYGTWTNKMPLSFLVPGYFQKVFGPGLSAGRYYAFFLSILILGAAVIIGQRLGGKWGGALTAVLITLNPAPLKIYSMVFSEGLVAFLMLTSLVLILGKDRPLWQILVGSFLVGLVPVTRINLLPFLPLVIIYLIWNYGPKIGLYGLLVSLTPIIGAHIIYWPEISRLWTRWLPESIRSILNLEGFNPFGGIRADQKNVSLLDRFLAIFQGIRMQFPALIGAFAVISLWPKKWTEQDQKREAVFLVGSFWILLLAHFLAAILVDHNVFAFFRYISFFYMFGIFSIITTWQAWNYHQPVWKQILIGLGIGFSIIGIAISNSELGSYYGELINRLLRIKGLFFENGKLVVADWKLWEIFRKLLGWDFPTTLRITGIVLFILLAVIILVGLLILYNRKIKSNTIGKQYYFSQALVIFLLLGLVLSPTEILGGGWNFYDCEAGVFQSYKDTANQILQFVESGDQVFWIGVDTQTVLLEMMAEKDFLIYPQQLNGMNSFRLGGDGDQLARIGYWSDSLAQDWVDGSQVLLFERQAQQRYFEDIFHKLDLSDFEEIGTTDHIACTKNQRITILRRK
jgi:hypothetical protein